MTNRVLNTRFRWSCGQPKTVHVDDYVSIHDGKPRLTRAHWRRPPDRGQVF